MRCWWTFAVRKTTHAKQLSGVIVSRCEPTPSPIQYLNASVASKSHLQQCNCDATVADVVARTDEAPPQQRLRGIECRCQGARLHIWRVVTNLHTNQVACLISSGVGLLPRMTLIAPCMACDAMHSCCMNRQNTDVTLYMVTLLTMLSRQSLWQRNFSLSRAFCSPSYQQGDREKWLW